MRLADVRGTDIRLDAGTPFRYAAWPRAPLDAGLWAWRVALSYRWRAQQHINILEATAVLDIFRHQVKRGQFADLRTLFLLDSQAALGVLTKGRSSSQSLNAVLLRLAAFTRFANATLLYGWAPSKGNPADGPSRWACRRP